MPRIIRKRPTRERSIFGWNVFLDGLDAEFGMKMSFTHFLLLIHSFTWTIIISNCWGLSRLSVTLTSFNFLSPFLVGISCMFVVLFLEKEEELVDIFQAESEHFDGETVVEWRDELVSEWLNEWVVKRQRDAITIITGILVVLVTIFSPFIEYGIALCRRSFRIIPNKIKIITTTLIISTMVMMMMMMKATVKLTQTN